jgi:hypothetical protein
MRLVAAVIMASLASSASAQKTVPGNRVYELHSQAQGTCPALDWHIVASPDGVLSGTFALPDRKMKATVAGSILPHVEPQRFGPSLGGDPRIQQFRMIASEIGSHSRIANITGIIQPDGWMIAAVEGRGVACQSIKVPLFVPASRP